MNIGEAAARSGVTAKTIRYYESIGLLPSAARRTNNYRDYSDTEVATLRFIARARGLGFSVKDVGQLLTLWRDRSRASHDVKALAQAHLGEIDRKIAALEAMRGTLQHLIGACHGDHRPDCPILDDLAGERAHSPHHSVSG